ncbi:hypothetical protein [Marinoscillum pacificum]|uniref:hypothetical protein n=1 Tax=Marinoscillum pacificum TaxID=392723 RepID=UPI00215747F2|nr:hypothetical protein [Marinoscillum pacificum]
MPEKCNSLVKFIPKEDLKLFPVHLETMDETEQVLRFIETYTNSAVEGMDFLPQHYYKPVSKIIILND